MDMVKGAKLLAELFEKRGAAPKETPKVEDGPPLFKWTGVVQPEADPDAKP